MSLTALFMEAIVAADGDTAVLDTGQAPYILAGHNVIELTREAATVGEVESILAEEFSAESLETLEKTGAAQQTLPPAPDFPGHSFTLIVVRVGGELLVQIRRDRIPLRRAASPHSTPATNGDGVEPIKTPKKSALADSTLLAPEARVPSGVPGLDALIGGGFPFHRTVLLCGDIGTGKTTFGLQFLMEGAKRGEAGLLVSVDEKPQHVLEDARRFGWDVGGASDPPLITVLGASPCFTALRGKSGLDARHVASDLTQQIRGVNASRLVIDGATSLVADGAPVAGVEDFLRSLIFALEDNLGCTTVLTARTSASTHTSTVGPTAERLTSGVIELKVGAPGRRGGHSLLVRKMRGAPMALGERPFDIVDGRGLVLREPD
jgi:circadian clock protein KaiC